MESLEKDSIVEERRKLEEEKKTLEVLRRSIEEEEKQMLLSAKKIVQMKSKDLLKPSSASSKSFLSKFIPSNSVKQRPLPAVAVRSCQIPSTDIKPRQFPPADMKQRQITAANVKLRQFPPPDVKSGKPKSSKLKVYKRRLYDESDEEYNSEFDDFIVDEAEDEPENYSRYIKEIFGYDKEKYRDFDDDDDTAMESNFTQQLKEEFLSTKIGKMEDLENMRQEVFEKQKKALMKKK